MRWFVCWQTVLHQEGGTSQGLLTPAHWQTKWPDNSVTGQFLMQVLAHRTLILNERNSTASVSRGREAGSQQLRGWLARPAPGSICAPGPALSLPPPLSCLLSGQVGYLGYHNALPHTWPQPAELVTWAVVIRHHTPGRCLNTREQELGPADTVATKAVWCGVPEQTHLGDFYYQGWGMGAAGDPAPPPHLGAFKGQAARAASLRLP